MRFARPPLPLLHHPISAFSDYSPFLFSSDGEFTPILFRGNICPNSLTGLVQLLAHLPVRFLEH